MSLNKQKMPAESLVECMTHNSFTNHKKRKKERKKERKGKIIKAQNYS